MFVEVRTVVRYATNCLPVSYYGANQIGSLGLPASSKRLGSLFGIFLYSGKQFVHNPGTCTSLIH
jgi:hypothetical protein